MRGGIGLRRLQPKYVENHHLRGFFCNHLDILIVLQITEFQLSQKIVYRSDFDNGVNSVLISKDHNPIWEPSKIDEINIEDQCSTFV